MKNDEFDDEDHRKAWIFFYVAAIVYPIVIFGGVFTNIFAFLVLVRSRLWLKHEGYVYLAANYWVNVGVLLFSTSTFWQTSVYGSGYYYPPDTSAFMCKVWHFLMSIFFASGWLSVALLLNVYLREHLIRMRSFGCPMFAAKYCTLFASKIIVGVIFGVLFICGVPYLAIYELRDSGGCYPSDFMDFIVVLVIELILMWFLPILFFLPIILLKMLCTKREGNIVGISQIEERSVSDDQMQVMAIILSSMTLFSQLVLVGIGLLFLSHRGTTVSLFIGLTFSLSLGLQPILCFVILKTLFREEFRSQLRDIRCCRRLFPSLIRYDEVVQMSAIQEDPTNITES